MPEQPVIVAIDIGTTKVCALVGQLDEESRLRVIGVGIVPSLGMRKGGVVNLTRALASELGEWNIQVNCISPGQIPTADTDPAMVEKARLNNPLEVVGRPEHLKGAVALLASSASDWITGQNLVVDGGWSIW